MAHKYGGAGNVPAEAAHRARQRYLGNKQFREDKAKSYDANPAPGTRGMSGKIRHTTVDGSKNRG